MTLVELLVVLTILLMIVGATIPLMSSALEGRRQREAARGLAAYLDSARSRARELGRPVGVRIEPFVQGARPGATVSLFSLRVAMIEEPPPYSGTTLGSVADVSRTTAPVGPGGSQREVLMCKLLSADFDPNVEPKLINLFDQVQLNHQGAKMTIIGPDSNNDGLLDNAELVLSIDSPSAAAGPGLFLAWPPAGSGPGSRVPYQVFRKPVKSSAAPLQLPQGAVIDTYCSGLGTEVQQSSGGDVTMFGWLGNQLLLTEPIDVLFAPNGRLDRLEYSAASVTANQPPRRARASTVLPLYLLLGKSDKIYQRDSAGKILGLDEANPNWRDAENLWLAVNPTSGQVTTAEIVPNSNLPQGVLNQTDQHLGVIYSRKLAQEGQQIGGR